jgi:hypothetical protein
VVERGFASDTTGKEKKAQHPGGMPETHGTRLWHPSGMLFLYATIFGGVARKTSLNHRLISGKPPACFERYHSKE